ncbi:alanine dehydrogenase [Qipengyuania qiaonensis]|uniref:Alanine dehydrogenase n=1 Tax=Qipengyuania qiaonensis TaxID=2867240 RepID=A0ABS7J6I6_9SPHN|nr:alanine dehydrogenase [Qipengyuania qiaonensis]MBX7482936.1 alanine dehydrogenase [Qipengyuania qiaonensis]
MIVGVPKEIKKQEARVGLTPAAVREYVERGHSVLVETKAGTGMGADDTVYADAGATIVGSAFEVFAQADMIVKVKEPQPEEWVKLREGQILFTYLHLAPDPEQTRGLLESGVTSIAYETVTEGVGLPLLAPMSEVAGRLSIEAAALASRHFNGGSGLLLGGVPGVAPARVLVLGGGVVGTHAARMAVGLGADVSILDRSLPRLRQLDELFCGRARTLFSTVDAIEAELRHADVVIGSVLTPGASAPRLVTKDMLGSMKPRSVVVDVAIDQGGCFETSRATSHAAPTYEVDGIIHYCVANMPGSVPRTSSHALNNATLPYGLALADGGLRAIRENRGLLAGLSTHRGRLTSEPVARALGLDFEPSADALGA